MTERMIGTVRKAYCSECSGDRNSEVVGHTSESGKDEYYHWRKDWYLLVCRGCDHVFAQSVATNSEDFYQEYDETGEIVTTYEETIEAWPARAKRSRPGWFEHGVVRTETATTALDASLTELYRALDNDLNVLASIGMRTAFDIAAEILGVNSVLPFKEKLEGLVEQGHIREAEKDHIAVLVDAGSASAHRGWHPSPADLDALMDTLESFIHEAFVLPAQKKVAAAKMAQLKAKVPPKPKQKPKPKPKRG